MEGRGGEEVNGGQREEGKGGREGLACYKTNMEKGCRG